MQRLFDLTGKVAVVTGASRGLGQYFGRALAGAGADLVITSRDVGRLGGFKAEIEALGRRALPLRLDVTVKDDIPAMVEAAVAEYGKIDILVNNAGLNIRAPGTEFTWEDWDTVLDTNLKGAFFVAQAAARKMIGRGYGRIINIGSALSLVGLAERTGYAASKGAVLQITRTLAVELAREGITVNCICPGPFATEINRLVLEDPAKSADLLAHVPMGRWGRLDEIEAPVVFLASRAAGYVTGVCLSVDGGWTAA